APALELREVGRDLDEDLLACVLRVLRVTEHPHGEPVDGLLQRRADGAERRPIATDGACGQVLERLVHHLPSAGSWRQRATLSATSSTNAIGCGVSTCASQPIRETTTAASKPGSTVDIESRIARGRRMPSATNTTASAPRSALRDP